jgi:MFS family permease
MITNIDELDSSTRYEKLESSTVGKKEPSQPRTLLERWKAQNPNVRHILYLVFFAGLSESMGFGPTLSSYLYISTGRSNLTVGYLDSAMGISKLLTALPMGDIADRYGRSPVSKVGSFAYTFATVITVFAIFARASNHIDDDAADDKYIIVLWAVALSIWGFGKGVVDGPVLALVRFTLNKSFH